MHSKLFAIALLAAVFVDAQNSNAENGLSNAEIDLEFLQWASQNNKHYESTASMGVHKSQFIKRMAAVDQLNSRPDRTATFALNFMADLTDEELAKMLGNNDGADDSSLADSRGRSLEDSRDRNLQNANYVNWATSGNLVPVKDQEKCGSCVAFAVSTCMEGLMSIQATAANSGTLVAPERLSEQHQVDCATVQPYGNSGCKGGRVDSYQEFLKVEGAYNYADYRAYTATDGACNPDATATKAGYISSYSRITTNVDDVITSLNLGPIPITLSAGNDAFFSYQSGVMFSSNGCPETAGHDHAVSLVGYGVETVSVDSSCRKATRDERRYNTCLDGSDYSTRYCCFSAGTMEVDYWLIQNSWSAGWGDAGFIKFRVQGGYGICGMNRGIRPMAL